MHLSIFTTFFPPKFELAPSGIATYGALGHMPPSSFGNSVYSAAAASLAVKTLKIAKEKHVLHFCISPQKHAKIVMERNRNPGQGRSGKTCCAPSPLISW